MCFVTTRNLAVASQTCIHPPCTSQFTLSLGLTVVQFTSLLPPIYDTRAIQCLDAKVRFGVDSSTLSTLPFYHTALSMVLNIQDDPC